jgi:phospholipase C
MTSQDASSFTVRVMTFNVQQLYDMGPKTWWDQANRAARIPVALASVCCQDNNDNNDNNDNIDILILNECFNGYATTIICQQLSRWFPHQTPVIGKSSSSSSSKWKSTSGNYRHQYHCINGGVVILSRHAILEQRQYIYRHTHASTWDCWANKGIAYAKIAFVSQQQQQRQQQQQQHVVHIFGTHLQADEGHVPHAETHRVRMAQLQELRTYLTEELRLPRTERVILGGDLNVEYTNESFRRDLETTLHTTIHYTHQFPGSFSAPHNWMTRANARANRQDEQRNETLDYLLVPNDYAQPLGESATFTVVPLKATSSWYWSYLAKQWPQETKGYHCDLSDHYPVMASFEFPTNK